MELIMPKEELRDIKKKIVFWFWFEFICWIVWYCVYFLREIIFIGLLLIPIILLIIFSSIMFLINLSKWFIEREN
ncbi:hypothetical protein [Candidatus Ruminimicrobium bovinum]|uniref:hypothetical protein n=1 Tax=Candidatus Ruminimicrobium bovinum TaxID=3242779 RepID=UPI0039B93E63